MKKLLFLSLGAIFFSACGNGNVDKVKNYTLSTFNTMTIGNAIEGSKICKDVKWEDLSKDGLSVVRVICYESDEYIKERNTKIENKYNKDLENYNKNIQSYETRLNDAIEDKKKKIEENIKRSQKSRDDV
ncbi:MAG: hypothetical protein MR582_05665, partial [Campylobacter sp.]|nr:hypothetical protein [Campylobacter sp.]